MATETLRPNDVGDESNLSPSAGDNYACVDEAEPDENTTYVETTSTSYLRDLYEVEASGVGAGTINSVTVYFRIATEPFAKATTYGKAAIKSGTTADDGDEESLSDDEYVTYSHTWTENPDTSAAWTWSDIADLQIGVSLKSSSTKEEARCTQVYVVIDYTAIVEYELSVSDGFKIGEAFARNMTAGLSLTEQVNLGETFAQLSTMNVSLAEGVLLGDLASNIKQFLLSLSEGFQMGDTTSYNMKYLLNLTEGILLGDTPLREMLANVSLAEGVNLGDALSELMTADLETLDSVIIGDTPLRSMTASKTLTEGVKLGDTPEVHLAVILALILKLYGRDLIAELHKRAIANKLRNRELTLQLYSRSLTMRMRDRSLTVEIEEVQ